jgi:ribosomal protein L11 methyltransferase
VELGAIDAERSDNGRLAALMPDSVPPEQVALALGVEDVSISPAIGRDAGSVWVLRLRSTRIGRLQIVPAPAGAAPDTLQLTDTAAFGTGLHPTTVMCLEALDEALQVTVPDAVLDVGTGSGVLALGALRLGVPRALGIDVDEEALSWRAAARTP